MEDPLATNNIFASPRWRMLAEFLPAEAADSEPSITVQIALALRTLALAPEQVTQVQNVITETLHHLPMRKQPLTLVVPVRVRVYCNKPAIASATKAVSPEQAKPSGGDASAWGFFLVEKLVSEAQGRHYLIELYLYEERC